MNQWLTESEKLIKSEEKIGSDIDVLQEQIKDNQVGFKSLNHAIEYRANQNTGNQRYSHRALHVCSIDSVVYCYFNGMVQATRGIFSNY